MGKRTNIVLDESLVEAGLKATGLKTRKDIVDFTLRDLLRRESQKKILSLNRKLLKVGIEPPPYVFLAILP